MRVDAPPTLDVAQRPTPEQAVAMIRAAKDVLGALIVQGRERLAGGSEGDVARAEEPPENQEPAA